MPPEFDILIKSGRILDGTGNPWYTADVGIQGGRITGIRREIDPQLARRIIDAHGFTVCPGLSTPTAMTTFICSSIPDATKKSCRA